MIKVIIFDLDDTLIPEKDYAYSAFSEISSYLSSYFNLESQNIFSLLKNLYDIDPVMIFDRLFTKYNIELSTIERTNLINMYRNHMPKIKLSNDVLTTLDTLRRRGYKLGIITDGYSRTQKNKIEALNLEKMVDKIIINDDMGREFWKPNPRSFQIMSEYFKSEYRFMIYIGDNPRKDFIAPKELGMKSIMIKRANNIFQKNSELINYVAADNQIENFIDILDFLELESKK